MDKTIMGTTIIMTAVGLGSPLPGLALPAANGHFIGRRRSVAQWLEHRSPKPGVGGSSPSTPASKNQISGISAPYHPASTANANSIR